MAPVDVVKKIWPYARPTLIRYSIAGLAWLVIHFGIKAVTPEAISTAVNANIDQLIPPLTVAVSTVMSWMEKKTLSNSMPQTVIQSLASQAIEPDPTKPEASVTITMSDLSPKDAKAVDKQISKV